MRAVSSACTVTIDPSKTMVRCRYASSMAGLLLVNAMVAPLHATETDKLTLLVPAYSYPGGAGLEFWEQLLSAANDVPIVAIANPNSGPGTKVDPNYAKIIAKAQPAGVRVIGYVATGYNKREPAAIERDIDKWKQFYPSIDGFFFDEQSSDAKDVASYFAISKYARRIVDKSLIVSNPGVVCAEEYVTSGAFDVICVFENSRGYDRFRLPDWDIPNLKTKFAALPHSQENPAAARRYAKGSPAKGISYLYVTHDALPNPWDELAKYWSDEVVVVRTINGPRR